jgi:hypothetical protein
MNAKSPPDRRKFANEWDEIGYLYDKLLYWLYQRAAPGKARPYALRLEQLLSRIDPDHEAIFGEECWSLVCEATGDLPRAIEHRENEVRLIRRLHKISSGTPSEEGVFKEYGYGDLSDRLDLLAVLVHDSGQLDKAMSILNESKNLCQEHRIRFDGADLLREYQQEKRNSPKGASAGTSRSLGRRSRRMSG